MVRNRRSAKNTLTKQFAYFYMLFVTIGLFGGLFGVGGCGVGQRYSDPG